jgi:4-amino-4-deoxy-L-arabinose transferase-like glycosyltransferase
MTGSRDHPVRPIPSISQTMRSAMKGKDMNKTVLGILGFLLLAPGLLILGLGGIFVGPPLFAVGTGLMILAIKPDWFKRYLVSAVALFLAVAGLLIFGALFGSHATVGAEIHVLFP